MRVFFLFISFVVFLLSGPGVEAGNNGLEELFFKSNQAYKNGNFKKAVDGYSKLISSDNVNGHIFYNLGNAYFRMGKLGQAVLNYERARILMPRDPDLVFNLRHARDQTVDAVSETRNFIDTTFFWLHSMNQREIFWGFAVANLLFWTILLLRLFFKVEWSYYLLLVFTALWLISCSSFAVKWFYVVNDDRAVIIEKEVNVLAGPDSRDTILFKLHEGTIVHLERSEDGWALVHLPDKKRGWLKGKAVEAVKIQGKT